MYIFCEKSKKEISLKETKLESFERCVPWLLSIEVQTADCRAKEVCVKSVYWDQDI